jgi:hypothetical protein
MSNINWYLSTTLLINQLSKKERWELKQSLLGKTIKIIVDPVYGLFTEHGFPVAIVAYPKDRDRTNLTDFYATVIEVNPMVTIDDRL